MTNLLDRPKMRHLLRLKGIRMSPVRVYHQLEVEALTPLTPPEVLPKKYTGAYIIESHSS